MRFLVDVNASGIVASWLAAMGHDVAEVAHKDPRLPDEQVLQWAVSERRIIVTTDRGFEEMVWRAGKAHGGILRLENLPRAQRKRLLEDVLARHSEDLQSGAIVIAMSRKTRIRKSPAGCLCRVRFLTSTLDCSHGRHNFLNESGILGCVPKR